MSRSFVFEQRQVDGSKERSDGQTEQNKRDHVMILDLVDVKQRTKTVSIVSSYKELKTFKFLRKPGTVQVTTN